MGLGVFSGIIKFACHAPLAIVGWGAKANSDFVYDHSTELLDPRFNHNIGRGERVLSMAVSRDISIYLSYGDHFKAYILLGPGWILVEFYPLDSKYRGYWDYTCSHWFWRLGHCHCPFCWRSSSVDLYSSLERAVPGCEYLAGVKQ
jgi:hypothetical protein